MSLQLVSSQKMFNGWQQRYRHQSEVNQCEMTFSVYVPFRVSQGHKVPVVYFLSGLTCSDENFSTKAGAQQYAAQLGLMLVMPDTSPRGEQVANDEAYDLGQGAGFYVNATEAPWAANYRMYDYIVDELPALIEANFDVTRERAIMGHSMGGHGALMIALKNSDRYSSVSAFAPIVNPMDVPWGQKAFGAYLGEDNKAWAQYDACHCVYHAAKRIPILIDQGGADDFYPTQLQPEKFVTAAKVAGLPVRFNMRPEYDHSYYFIASFVESHLAFHAEHLGL